LSVRIGINGLGRIGRTLFRLGWESEDFTIAAVNDLAEPRILAHLLRHDSIAGTWRVPVQGGDGSLLVGGRSIPCTSWKSPAEVPWKAAGVDLVVEATGWFRTRRTAEGHLKAGAGRVVISAPSPDADLTTVVGVNHRLFDPARHRILSNASCTANCVAPLLHLLDRAFGVECGTMTTVHCFTNDQFLVDAPHADLRRARSAPMSIIPTTTSAAQALDRVLPGLAGRIACLAVRVPTSNVSAVDLTVQLRRDAGLPEVRELFRQSAEGELAGIVGYEEDELVSVDYRGDSRSAVVDATLLALPSPRLLRVFAWYDNETGYTHRLMDLIRHLAGTGEGAT
jgi:glyceraldehyde 3-phosphate dehydrogenase